MHRLHTWTRGHIEVLRAWQRHAPRPFAKGPRLTAIYSYLTTLPLAQQAQWRRRCKATLWGVALCLAASGVTPAAANTITVDGSCTLVDAITAANTDTTTGFCAVGGGADTIELTVDTTLTASNNSIYGPTGLPVVSSVITIAGNGKTIVRTGGPAFRLLAISSAGDLTLQDTTVSGGLAAGYSGGGILNRHGQLRLEGCTVSGNSAVGLGGGVSIFADGSDTVSLVNSTLSGNSATAGGGAYSRTDDSSTVSLVNSTLSGNSASGSGGGMLSRTYDTSTVALHRSLIVGNTTTDVGDEVRRINSGGSFLVDDANLFGHSGITTVDALYGVTVGVSDIVATSDGTDPTALAAMLDTILQNNGGPTLTHALVTGSPAIDAAGACGLPTDQRGFVRNVGACDIGAYEFGAQPPTDPCDGATPTLGCKVNGVLNQPCVGTPGKDVIIGTNGDDVIVGGAGNDKLRGKDGDDVLCGEAGNDLLFGGKGDDMLIGGADNDALRGDAGNDTLDGGSGNDRLFGGPGNDDLVGGDDTDTLKGDAGIDSCDGETEVTCEL